MVRECFESILDALCANCKLLYSERLVTLGIFGSVGRGTPNLNSDIDMILIVRNLPRGRMSRIHEFESVEGRVAPAIHKAAELGCHTALSPVIKTPDEVEQGSLLFLDMIHDIRFLHDRDGFFRNFLREFHQTLKERNARRVPCKGAWYWDLKPGYTVGAKGNP